MDEDLDEFGQAAGTDLPPDMVEEVDTGPDDRTPREVVEGEGLSESWLRGTTNEGECRRS